MSRLQEVYGKYHITVPKALVIAKNWKKGQRLLFKFNQNGELVLTEPKANNGKR